MKKLVAVLLTFLLVLTGCTEVKVTKVKDDIKTDNIKFSEEYKTVSKNNVFEYSTYGNVIDVLETGTGIIYFGYPSCELCKDIVPILNEVSKSKKITSILYYDFREIRSNNTKEYKYLVDKLSDLLTEDQEGIKRITAPTILFINKGNIVYSYIGNKEKIEDETLKNMFSDAIEKMYTYETTTTEIETAE